MTFGYTNNLWFFVFSREYKEGTFFWNELMWYPEMHVWPFQTSMMELFYKNSERLKAIDYFRIKIHHRCFSSSWTRLCWLCLKLTIMISFYNESFWWFKTFNIQLLTIIFFPLFNIMHKTVNLAQGKWRNQRQCLGNRKKSPLSHLATS